MKTPSIQSSIFATAVCLAWALTSLGMLQAEEPPAEIFSTKIISQQPEFYHGWSTLSRQKSGRLMLVWSGRREGHVCPFGTLEWMTSEDNGKT